MLRYNILHFFLVIFIPFLGCNHADPEYRYDVIVLGGGTGGTAAAIQAARSGASTLLVEPTPWLGGMLTAAGVSAVDGNHQLPSGIWGEFRDSLYAYYGGVDQLATGWVSHTQFEPSVGARIFKNMAHPISNLKVLTNTQWSTISRRSGSWRVDLNLIDLPYAEGTVLIDGTDLGDVAAQVGVSYDLGMESNQITNEHIAPDVANKIIQDFTYVAILKDFQKAGPHVLKSSFPGYDPQEFLCACDSLCDDPEADIHPCNTMINYAKLPGDKYMINWPIQGNDYYANMVEMNEPTRDSVYQRAKEHTLNFVYFLQHELGMKNLGLANDEFTTEDKLPYIPYHREGRRIHGLSRFTLNHIERPYDYTLYRTGIASGDYPVDHHHRKNPQVPQLAFYPVPSFTVPLGTLIPTQNSPFLVADKSISVSNIANGSTRLQPVILQIGQAAGVVGSVVAKDMVNPADISIRLIQDSLINNQVYIQPFLDVPLDHPHFAVAQRIGATGIIRGTGIPHQWANQTWFYPDRLMRIDSLFFMDYYPHLSLPQESPVIKLKQAFEIIESLNPINPTSLSQVLEWIDKKPDELITRIEMALLIDRILDPFHQRDVDWQGRLK